MAISILRQNKPHLWLSVESGGSLPDATTFYLIGWNAFTTPQLSSPYYGYAPGVASDEVSITTTAANQKIKMEIYQLGGDVSAYADAGSGYVTVTATAHGLSNGDVVYVRGTTNYDGYYTISNVATDTFDILATWAGDDGASKWFSLPGMVAHPYSSAYSSFYFKWDYYTMLRADGSYIQWCNTNDPAINDEWYPTEISPSVNWRNYGHARWGGSYYNEGRKLIQFSTGADGSKYCYYDQVVITTAGSYWNAGKFYERNTNTSVISGQLSQPQVALQKYTNVYSGTPGELQRTYDLPDGMDYDSPAIQVWIDNTDTANTFRDFMLAVNAQALDLLGKSIVINRAGSIASASLTYSWNEVTLRGNIDVINGTFSVNPSWEGKKINLIHGFISANHSATSGVFDNNILTLNTCVVTYHRLAGSFWIKQRFNAINTIEAFEASSNILDTMGLTSGFQPMGLAGAIGSTYNAVKGLKIVGNPIFRNNNVNAVRYIRPGINNTMDDCEFYYSTANPTFSGSIPSGTYYITNTKFYQPQSDDAVSGSNSYWNMDIAFGDGYMTGQTLDFDIYCNGVSAQDRADKLVKVCFHTPTSDYKFNSNSRIDVHFAYNISHRVRDKDGNPLANATITIENEKGDIYTDVTDSNGYLSLPPECYIVQFDPNNSDGWTTYSNPAITAYWHNSKTTVYNNLTITIEKAGYETYKGNLKNVLEDHNIATQLKQIVPIRLLAGDGVSLALQPELGSSSLLKKV